MKQPQLPSSIPSTQSLEVCFVLANYWAWGLLWSGAYTQCHSCGETDFPFPKWYQL